MIREHRQLIVYLCKLLNWFDSTLSERQQRSRQEVRAAADAFALRASRAEPGDGETNYWKTWVHFSRREPDQRSVGLVAALLPFPPATEPEYEDHELSLIVGLSMVREALVLALSPSTQNLCHAALLLAEARELQADWCNNVGFSGCKVPDAGIQRIQQLLGELAAEPFILERIRRNQGKGGFQTFLNNERIQRARAMAKRLLIEFQAGRGRHRRKSGRMNRTSLAKEVMDTCMAPTTVEKVRKWLREFEADPERT